MTTETAPTFTLPPPPGNAAAWDIFVYSHTHWDREWYQPFERFRMQLVGIVDRVLDTLASDDRYLRYTLDGQTIVVEDYLAVCPDRREQLIQAVRDGRLEIGPWYILPDEFLASGESLIRNLMVGREVGERYGGWLDVGYLPDPFGHVAQIPQLLQGFGIDTTVFSRGMGDEIEDIGNEFWWEGPDGSKVLAIVQSSTYTSGYCNAEFLARARDVADGQYIGPMDELVVHLASQARTPSLLLAAGCDHWTINPALPDIVDHLAEHWSPAQVRMCGLGDFAAATKAWVAEQAQAGSELASWGGELRGSRNLPILSGIFSARVPLKQQNARIQTWLECYTEPMVSLAGLQGIYFAAHGLLRHAWELVLSNQPHDSIGGCSVDTVHDEMPMRTKNALDVCVGLMQEIATTLGMDHVPLVFNPDGSDGRGIIRLLDADHPPIWVDKLAPFSVNELSDVRADGGGRVAGPRTIESPLLRVHAAEDGRVDIERVDTAERFADVLRFVDVADVGDEYDFSPLPDGELVARLVDCEAIAFDTGVAQLRLVHEIDIPAHVSGDRTRRVDTRISHTVTTRLQIAGDQPWVECIVDLDNQASDHRLRVRVNFDQRVERSVANGHFAVTERLARPAPPKTRWIQDSATSHFCESFAAIEHDHRGIAVFTEGLHEYEVVETEPGSALELTLLRCIGWLSRPDIVGRHDGNAGPQLATPGAQCPGPFLARFAIAPYGGDWQSARIPEQARWFAAPPFIVEPVDDEVRIQSGHRARVRELLRQAGDSVTLDLLNSHGLSVDGMVLSCLKPSADQSGDLILRGYNPYRDARTARICVGESIARITQVRLDERSFDVDSEIEPIDGAIEMTVEPAKIVTLRLHRAPGI